MPYRLSYKNLGLILFFACNIVILVIYNTSFLDIAKFLGVVIGASLIPGLFILNKLGLYKANFYRYPLAIMVGIALDILLYIFFSALNFKVGLYFVLLGFVLWYLLSQQLREDIKLIGVTFRQVSIGDFIWFIICSFLILGLVSILYFKPNILPGVASVIYSVDYPWHIGNIAEIKNNWFPENPRLSGYPFNYHIFFHVYIAFLAYLTNISIAVLFFRLYVWLFFNLLLLGSYYLGSYWYGNKSIGKILAIITIFIGTALCSHPANLFLKDLFYSPTFFLAVIIFIYVLIEIKAYLSSSRNLPLILLLLFALIGAKGSFFPLLWAGLFLTTIYNFIVGRDIRRLSLLLISSLIIFIPTYLYIFKTPGGEGLNLIPLTIMFNTKLYQSFITFFNLVNYKVILAFIPLYLVAFFSFRLFAFLNLLRNSFLNFKNITTENFLLLSITIVSFIPAYLLNYRGDSQYFFLFVGFITLNLLTAFYLYNLFYENKKIGLKVIIAIFLVVGLFDTGIMIKSANETNYSLANITQKPLTPDIYEGLAYIRDNTPLDVVIGSYRVFLINEDNPRFFYYSAFAERRVVIEGYMYNPYRYIDEAQIRYEDMQTLFRTKHNDKALSIMNKYNIDIILVDKRAKQKLYFDTKGLLEKVHENQEIALYRKII